MFQKNVMNSFCVTRYGQRWAKFKALMNSSKNQQARIAEVSRLPTVFLTKKLSKYRLKPPKYIVLGTRKKPDKIPKMSKIVFE